MTASGGAAGRLARAVWTGEGFAPALARGALLLPAALYRAGAGLRNAAYDAGILRSHPFALPAVGVGNLSVGGTGKTPLCRYLASELEHRGRRVGILLRGYGGDEAEEYRESLPNAIVVADADRRRGAAAAAARGAEVLVLDDCLQRRDVRPEVMLAVVAAEADGRPRWPLPAGPWREGYGALRRADAVVVTRKTAGGAEAGRLAARLAPRTRSGVGLVVELVPTHLVSLTDGQQMPVESLRGRRVVAVCGVGAPDAFAYQIAALGAGPVDLLAFGDHHAYMEADVRAVRERAGADALVVTTGKDAVKLRRLWPLGAPAAWIASLGVRMDEDGGYLARTLDRLARAGRDLQSAAAAPPARGA